MQFTKVPIDAGMTRQVNAGIIATDVNLTAMTYTQISATTGGINATCVPTFVDTGENIDNAPKNTLDFKKLDTWECKLSTTLQGITAETLALSLGAVDVTIDADGKTTNITPRSTIKKTDFKDIWFLGDMADGGFLAIQVKNALSNEGLNFQSVDGDNGTLAFAITGHISADALDVVPMQFYLYKEPTSPITKTTKKDSE